MIFPAIQIWPLDWEGCLDLNSWKILNIPTAHVLSGISGGVGIFLFRPGFGITSTVLWEGIAKDQDGLILIYALFFFFAGSGMAQVGCLLFGGCITVSSWFASDC